MEFRYARHTTSLQQIEDFYTRVMGLEKLGGFKAHDNYDGIFLGLPGLHWHLEFTASHELPVSKFDEDDALVFYVNTVIEMEALQKRIAANNISTLQPKNPYWVKNGLMIADPDGYKIIFSIKHIPLTATDPLIMLAKEKEIHNWSDLLVFVRSLPYGRNANREDLSLVLKEGKGTCSSKHALLKKIADLNNIEQVQLVMGMYKMDNRNTPKTGTILSGKGLNYIPEAHCYLKLNNKRFDLTSDHSSIEKLEADIIEETTITPEQVSHYKVTYHKNYIKKWMEENAVPLSFEEVWGLREECIRELSEKR